MSDRTLADIEVGRREASDSTYSMLENALRWAPGSIKAILDGGEAREVMVERQVRPTEGLLDLLRRVPTEILLAEIHRRTLTGPGERRETTDWLTLPGMQEEQ